MNKKLIFFVDDDSMMLNLMEYTFSSREGFNVKSYKSGEACIENIHLNPSLIVLDYILNSTEVENMSGLETLQKIKEYNPKIPVVILSTQKNTDVIEEFISLGAEKYVSKDDFFIDTLIETIEEIFK